MGKRRSTRLPALKDWHLWSEVTRSVSPLRRGVSRVAAASQVPAGGAASGDPGSTGPARAPRPVRQNSVPTPAAAPVAPPPSRQTLDPRLRRRLARGQASIDATLDLHGMTQAEAQEALQRFLPSRAARGDRTVLIITGKGMRQVDGARGKPGVLRTMLPRWLGEPALSSLVAGWETASQAHGGGGAFYVRLKRAGR